MGSLNSDGTRISQSREMVRNIGRAHTVSADRTETETNLDQAPEAASDELGTNADLTTSQYSAVAVSEVVKISTPVGDDLVAREYEQTVETPVHQNPPWVGLGGGGSQDLESVLAEGNTGSGIVLSEALILGSADTNGVRLEVNAGSLYIKDGDDSGYPSLGAGAVFDPNGGKFSLNSNGQMSFASDSSFVWSSTSLYSGSKDTGLKRAASGIVQVTDGASGSGTLFAKDVIIGAQDTNGAKLKLNAGVLEIKEGDDSGYIVVRSSYVDSFSSSANSVQARLSSSTTTNDGGLRLAAARSVLWTSTTDASSASTTAGIKRYSDAILETTDGSTGLGAMRARRHVEVVTMASGEAITLAAASGQVIIVKGSNTREVNLPSGASLGLIYDIKDGDGTASSGNITVDGNGATIDGEASFALDVNYASYTFVYNGTEWNLI